MVILLAHKQKIANDSVLNFSFVNRKLPSSSLNHIEMCKFKYPTKLEIIVLHIRLKMSQVESSIKNLNLCIKLLQVRRRNEVLLVKNINQLMTLNYKTLGQLISQIIVK